MSIKRADGLSEKQPVDVNVRRSGRGITVSYITCKMGIFTR